MHALIIEDEPIIAMLIEDHLRALGYTSVDFAVTEAEAVAAARRRCPDLITSDVRLPEGCGIAAVEAICGGGRIPVVFITATAGGGARAAERSDRRRQAVRPLASARGGLRREGPPAALPAPVAQ